MAARDRKRPADHAHQRAVRQHAPPHRHEPLLRQSGAAAQPARQLHRHELLPVRAPPLPARRVRGDRLPAADGAAQELRRHPHGHGHPRPADARHLLRRVHHPVGRCRLHARAHPPQGACAPHGDLRQRLHRGALHGHQRRRNPRSRPDRADPGRRAASGRRRRSASRASEGPRGGCPAPDPGRGRRRRALIACTGTARGAGRPCAARAGSREDHCHRLGRRRQFPRAAAPRPARRNPPDRRAALPRIRCPAAYRAALGAARAGGPRAPRRDSGTACAGADAGGCRAGAALSQTGAGSSDRSASVGARRLSG